MSISTHFSALLQADIEGNPPAQPKRCCYCGNAYSPVTGKIVDRPFLWVNCSDGVCKLCYPKRLEAARETARRMAR